jgi:hypothetical protein
MASSRVKMARISRQYGFGEKDFRLIRLFAFKGAAISVIISTKVKISMPVAAWLFNLFLIKLAITKKRKRQVLNQLLSVQGIYGFNYLLTSIKRWLKML